MNVTSAALKKVIPKCRKYSKLSAACFLKCAGIPTVAAKLHLFLFAEMSPPHTSASKPLDQWRRKKSTVLFKGTVPRDFRILFFS
jgi:hypothetical protein